MFFKRLHLLFCVAVMLTALMAPSRAYALCANPSGVEGEIVYNTTHKIVQYCDNTNWISMAGGGSGGGGSDPRIGTLTSGKWCDSDGVQINCTQDPPAANAGADTQVIFNDGGTLTGEADLVWDKTLNRLTVVSTGFVKSGQVELTPVAGDPPVAGSGGVWSTNGTNVWRPSGNVGVGLSTPATLMHLSSAVPMLTLTDTDTGADGQISASSGAGSLYLLADANNEAANSVMGFWVDGSEKMQIATSGNVGIGTTSPGNRLTVRTAANASTDGIMAISPDATYVALIPDLGTGALNGLVQAGDSGLIFSNSAIDTGNLVIGPWGTGNKGMRITNGGYVGIGTTSPAKQLHIVGAGGGGWAGLRIEDPNTAAGGFAHITLRDRGPASADDEIWDMRVTDTGKLMFGTLNDAETAFPSLVTFQRDGNVGIGTTTPDSYILGDRGLSIQGTTRSTLGLVGSATTDATISDIAFFNAASNQRLASIWAMREGANDAGAIVFGTQAASGGFGEKVRIDKNGNVGIGTSSPQGPLHVALGLADPGSARFYAPLAADGNFSQIRLGYGDGSFQSSGLRFIRYAAGNELMLFHWGDSYGIHLKQGGNVGIGTSSPQTKLHVTGSGIFGSASQTLGTFAYGGVSIDGSTAGRIYVARANADTVMEFGWQPTNTRVGSIAITSGSTSFNTTSDRRKKENIVDTSLGLETLMRLPVHDFSFIDDPAHKTHTGFIAQELYKIFPQAVTTNGDDGEVPLSGKKDAWAVDYGKVTPLIVKAVQDLNGKVETLEAENAALKAQNADILKRLDALEAKQ